MSEGEIDRQLEELREESRQQLKKMSSRGAMVMIIFSLVLAAVFMYIFYLSPRRLTDVIVVVFAIFGSVGLFTVGLKRALG